MRASDLLGRSHSRSLFHATWRVRASFAVEAGRLDLPALQLV